MTNRPNKQLFARSVAQISTMRVRSFKKRLGKKVSSLSWQLCPFLNKLGCVLQDIFCSLPLKKCVTYLIITNMVIWIITELNATGLWPCAVATWMQIDRWAVSEWTLSSTRVPSKLARVYTIHLNCAITISQLLFTGRYIIYFFWQLYKLYNNAYRVDMITIEIAFVSSVFGFWDGVSPCRGSNTRICLLYTSPSPRD